MTKKFWTGPEEKRLVELANAGVPAAVIADQLGRSTPAIYCRAHVLGVQLAYPIGDNNAGARLPDEVVRAIRLLNAGGMDGRSITRLLNRNFRICHSHVCSISRGRFRNDQQRTAA